MMYREGGNHVNTNAPAQVSLIERLRVSVWLEDLGMVLGSWKDKEHGVLSRNSANANNADGFLDDVCALGVIRFSDIAQDHLAWFAPSTKALIKDAIALCHKNHIRLLAGYTMTEEGTVQSTLGKAFRTWLRNPSRSPTLQQHAQAVMNKLFAEGDWDGICFDIELNGLDASDAPAFTDFYGELANLLAAKTKYLTVATAIGVNKSETNLLGHFKAQPFRLAKGKPNIIIQPMAYDQFQLSDTDFEKWHQDTIDYALNDVGLQPSQLQLGLKTSNNVRPKDPKWTPPPGWSPRKCCFDAQGVKDRCKKMLRPKRVGVITFAGWSDSKTINQGLNPTSPPANTVKEPLQQPITTPLP